MSEAKVSKGALPKGYAFVPKGNVYITSNCRKLTQERGRPVFTVIDAKNRQIGIGVPTDVYLVVQFKETETRADRAANVLKRDEGMAKGFERDIMNAFPQIPASSLRKVSKVALEKGKGKVGRTGKLDIQRKVHLAVRAHIRHCETDYDKLLRNGVAREDARQQIAAKIQEVCKAWGGGSQSKHGKPAKTPKSPTRLSTKVSQPTKRVKQDIFDQEPSNTETSRLTAADSIEAILREAETAPTAANNLFARHAMRSHRQNAEVVKSVSSNTEATKQQTASPRKSTPKVVPTAASFRERRTPKPRVTQPLATSPSPARADAPRASHTTQTRHTTQIHHTTQALAQEDRARIRRCIAQIGKIEDMLTRECRRRTRKLRTIERLYGRINAILTGAAIDKIGHSAAARKNFVRRFRLAMLMVGGP